jgi:hypothetical protein
MEESCFEKLIVAKLVKKFPPLKECEGWLLFFRDSRHGILHFNIYLILSYLRPVSNTAWYFLFSDYDAISISYLPCAGYMSRSSDLPLFRYIKKI